MNAFATHIGFEFRTGIRDRNLLLMNYLFPLGFYLAVGFIMTAINPLFRPTLLPAMVTFVTLVATLLGLPDPLVKARESGIFRSYKINGVPALNLLVIPALTTGLHLIIATTVITLTAPLLFDAPPPTNWPAFIGTFLALTFACAGLGVLIGVIAPSTRLTVLYSQLIFLPSMLIGGLMLPYNLLPQGAQMVARLLPATQAMNAFNGLAMGATADFNPWASLVALVVGGALAFVLALFLFRWDSREKRGRRSALMALLLLIPYGMTWLF